MHFYKLTTPGNQLPDQETEYFSNPEALPCSLLVIGVLGGVPTPMGNNCPDF